MKVKFLTASAFSILTQCDIYMLLITVITVIIIFNSNQSEFTSASPLSMNLSTTCRKYLKLSSRTKSYSQSLGDITTPPCDPIDDLWPLWPPPDLDNPQLVGLNWPLSVCWSETDRVAGDVGSAWHVADLWIPAVDVKSSDTPLPFLTSLKDMPGSASAATTDMCIPTADTESTDTLLLFLTWLRDLPDMEVCCGITNSSLLGGGAIFNSLCINFFKSDNRWSCFFITW